MSQPSIGIEPLHDFNLVRTANLYDLSQELARQLSAHRFEVARRRERPALINRVQLDATVLLYVDFGAPTRIATDGIDTHIVVVLPINHPVRIEMNERVFAATPSVAAVVPPGSSTRIVGEPDISCLVAKVSLSDISRHLHRLAPHTVGRPIAFEATEPLNAALIAGATHALHLPFDFGCPDLPGPVQLELHHQMMSALLFGCRHTASRMLWSPAPTASREKIFRAVELIEESPSDVIDLVALAESVGLSLRTLQHGFRRHVGVSPREYLKRVRLRKAREELLAANPDGETRVTEVALKHGFTHLGRFAADYRDTFGESPSESLRDAGAGHACR